MATGVEWIKEARRDVRRQRADREVDLLTRPARCGLPQLLQLSGVGPADLLRQFGVRVVADSPEVGRNLQDHYQARLIARLKQPISLNDQVRNPFELAKMGLQWMLSGSGPLTVGAGQVGGAACTAHAVGGRPDVQFNVMPLSVDKPGDPLHAYSGFTASVWQCHGQSRGQLAIRSTDPFDQARVSSRTILPGSRPQDDGRGPANVARDLSAEIVSRPLGYRSGSGRGRRYARPRLWDFARTTGRHGFSIASALAGWGAMHRHRCSIRSFRVRGVLRDYVIDASVMPQITSANTNATSLMIGERGAATLVKCPQ